VARTYWPTRATRSRFWYRELRRTTRPNKGRPLGTDAASATGRPTASSPPIDRHPRLSRALRTCARCAGRTWKCRCTFKTRRHGYTWSRPDRPVLRTRRRRGVGHDRRGGCASPPQEGGGEFYFFFRGKNTGDRVSLPAGGRCGSSSGAVQRRSRGASFTVAYEIYRLVPSCGRRKRGSQCCRTTRGWPRCAWTPAERGSRGSTRTRPSDGCHATAQASQTAASPVGAASSGNHSIEAACQVADGTARWCVTARISGPPRCDGTPCSVRRRRTQGPCRRRRPDGPAQFEG